MAHKRTSQCNLKNVYNNDYSTNALTDETKRKYIYIYTYILYTTYVYIYIYMYVSVICTVRLRFSDLAYGPDMFRTSSGVR